jgi:hypothetical protein
MIPADEDELHQVKEWSRLKRRLMAVYERSTRKKPATDRRAVEPGAAPR